MKKKNKWTTTERTPHTAHYNFILVAIIIMSFIVHAEWAIKKAFSNGFANICIKLRKISVFFSHRIRLWHDEKRPDVDLCNRVKNIWHMENYN